MQTAVEEGHLNVLQWLASHGCVRNSDWAL